MIEQTPIARLEEKVDLVVLLLTGNGKPERGIIVRLDRLERFVLLIGFIVAPLLAAGASWFATHFLK